MIPGIETFYDRIAYSIQGAIDENWTTATMDAIFFDDSITFFGEYTTSDGRVMGFGTTRDGQRAFQELRQKFADSGKPLWGQATFEMNAEGKFTMNWGYENCDENGDTIFDEEREHQREDNRRKRLIAGAKQS